MNITFLFVLLIGVTTGLGNDNGIPPEPLPTSSIVPPTIHTTTSQPNTTTSIVPPTSTPKPTQSPNTTVSTVSPTTSPQPTQAPNTTVSTVSPTTSPQPTQAPNTTTSTVSPTTSPQPGPTPNTTSTSAPPTSTPIPPEPKTGKWSVKDKNVTCIVADMALQLNITFGTDERKTVILDVPDSANSSGSCDNVTQKLTLDWKISNATATITIGFEKNDTTKVFSMASVNVSLPVGVVPGFNASLDYFENKDNFSTPLSKSYKCAKEQQIHLTHSDNSTAAVVKISHVQFEAFREKQDENFGSAEDCESSNSSTDVVPIAVGCVLVGLVVIVLVAYLVGRRRSQSRGYLSM